METIISVQHVVKKYKAVTAVNDISFDVYKGEIFGFLVTLRKDAEMRRAHVCKIKKIAGLPTCPAVKKSLPRHLAARSSGIRSVVCAPQVSKSVRAPARGAR